MPPYVSLRHRWAIFNWILYVQILSLKFKQFFISLMYFFSFAKNEKLRTVSKKFHNCQIFSLLAEYYFKYESINKSGLDWTFSTLV